jgi:hypothetical protein
MKASERLKYGGGVYRKIRVCGAYCPRLRNYCASYYAPEEYECTHDDDPADCGYSSPDWIPAFPND